VFSFITLTTSAFQKIIVTLLKSPKQDGLNALPSSAYCCVFGLGGVGPKSGK
jgi:hypothetical protein